MSKNNTDIPPSLIAFPSGRIRLYTKGFAALLSLAALMSPRNADNLPHRSFDVNTQSDFFQKKMPTLANRREPRPEQRATLLS
jgi:hypothetical protein